MFTYLATRQLPAKEEPGKKMQIIEIVAAGYNVICNVKRRFLMLLCKFQFDNFFDEHLSLRVGLLC